MATVKLVFRESPAAEGEGSIYMRVIHRRGVRQLNTGCRIVSAEWDVERCMVVTTTVDTARSGYLDTVSRQISDSVQRIRAIIADLDRRRHEYSVDDVVDRFRKTDVATGYISFARKLIAKLHDIGKERLSEHYATALSSLVRYHGKSDISFGDIDDSFIAGYESYLKETGLTPNTTSYYMRNLRAIFNKGVEVGLDVVRNPFKHVYTGVAKTVKRAVSIETIKELRRIDVGSDPLTALARDLFLFSFYTRGMAIVDIANLRKCSLKNGSITYRRQKTGKQLSIRWEPQMRDIANRHTVMDSDFIFPMIDSRKPAYRRQYLNAYNRLSRRLKKLGDKIGLAEPLTFHRARHAWASIARDNDVPLSIICEGMGHDSEKTTRIYLASIDNSVVDNANNRIISLLDK